MIHKRFLLRFRAPIPLSYPFQFIGKVSLHLFHYDTTCTYYKPTNFFHKLPPSANKTCTHVQNPRGLHPQKHPPTPLTMLSLELRNQILFKSNIFSQGANNFHTLKAQLTSLLMPKPNSPLPLSL